MEEQELRNRVYSYAFYAACVISLVAAIVLYNLFALILACILLLLSGAFFASGHIINNLLVKHSKVIEIYNGYALSEDLTGVRKRVGNRYYGVSVALLRLRKDSGSKEGELLAILENIKEPFQFSIEARQIEKRAILEALETKQKVKEIAISRMEERAYSRANEAKRELGLIESEINSIREGGKAFEVLLKIKASSFSGSEAEATRISARNLEQIANAFAVRLNLDYEILKGEALLSAVELI